MGDDAEKGQPEGEPVDNAEQELQYNDGINEAREQSFGKHRVFLDEF